MDQQPDKLPGTIIWVAPFWNRSGYGVSARTFVSALYNAGVRIRAIPVNEVEFGIDDCELALMKLLETTPVIPPVTFIVSHVPSRSWLNMVELPEPNLRIMATTFDSSAQGNSPPADWMSVCDEMDQVWFLTEKEREVFINAGLPSEKVRVVHWPSSWLENPVLDPPNLEPSAQRFRFLSVAMFLPRRRWDVLIEAYFEEFKRNDDVELYLKVNYPSWHPEPGKPEQDLHDLVEMLRRKTGSDAALVIDDETGRRTDIVRLMDSCSIYISTDTTPTAPLSEAWARQRIAIMPDGLGYFGTSSGSESPTEPYIGIAVDPDAKYLLTKDMLLYQPHHKGAFMPKLHVNDVRNAMRRAYDMPLHERLDKMSSSTSYLVSPAAAACGAIQAINAGWKYKEEFLQLNNLRTHLKRIVWEGPVFSDHYSSSINRELCHHLLDSGHEVSIIPSGKETEKPDVDVRYKKIASRINHRLSGIADIHVRNQWPPVLNPPPQGHWVMIQSWEFGRLPEDWVEPLGSMVDEIWVPSRHVRQSFISSGIQADRVCIVPKGINADQFYPVQNRSSESRKKFRFLFVGRPIWQKGIDILLKAYQRTFTRRDDVVLIIKDPTRQAAFADQGVQKTIAEMQKDPTAPEVFHYTEQLDQDQMRGLYNACDCLVLPYRAEGFGISVLEAMACGIPVITTAGGSTDDFCKPQQTYLIPARHVTYAPGNIRLAGGAGWVLEPDAETLNSLLREAYEKSSIAVERAMAASEFVRSRYAWEQIAEMVKNRVQVLTRQPILRNLEV